MPIDDYLEKLEIKPEEQSKPVQQDEDLDLDYLLGKLKHQEARDEVIRKAVMNGITTKKEHIQIVIKMYSESSCFGYAAELAEKIGWTGKAIEFYVKEKNFKRAAEIAKANKRYRQAIKLYEKGSHYHEAGKISEEIGDFKKAFHFYQFGSKEDIERLKQTRQYKLWMMDEAEKSGSFDSALHFAEKLGDNEKVKLYKSIIKLFYKETPEENQNAH